MTTTTLTILILCIGVPIIIATVILIRKGLEESNPLLPQQAAIITFCLFLIIWNFYK